MGTPTRFVGKGEEQVLANVAHGGAATGRRSRHAPGSAAKYFRSDVANEDAYRSSRGVLRAFAAPAAHRPIGARVRHSDSSDCA